jgi:arylsulfatase A-like enzyme
VRNVPVRRAGPRAGRVLRGAAVAGLVAILGGCPSKPAPPGGPNVLLIVVDTLRADALECYGGREHVSPRIDALARQGVRFQAAFAHAPWTLPSFAALFTSLPPQAHGAGGNVREGWRALGPEHTTLAERFQQAGFATGAVVNVDFLTAPFGMAQGFDDVDARISNDNKSVRRAEPTTDAALVWIDAHRERPFFLMVHYFDPHAEYDPPPLWRARFAEAQDKQSQAFRFGAREHVVRHRGGQMPLDAATLARARGLYDGEVAYTDNAIGRLLDGLASRGLEAGTIVVLTADHGEEFGDHGSWEHGHTHYDELLHVPLVVRAPGLSPIVVHEPVGLVDVAPTLCSLASLPPAGDFRGRDLAPALRAGGALPPLACLTAYGNFWGAALSSWRDAQWKLIEGGQAPHLFAWTRDLRESQDRASDDAVLAAARASMEACLGTLGARVVQQGPVVRPDAEALERIHDVGYTDGSDGR